MDYTKFVLDHGFVHAFVNKNLDRLANYVKIAVATFHWFVQSFQRVTGIIDTNLLALIVVACIAVPIGGILFTIGSLKGKNKSQDTITTDTDKAVKSEVIPKNLTADDIHKNNSSQRPVFNLSKVFPKVFDLDEFMMQMHTVPILIQKHNGKDTKIRCLKFSKHCEVKLYKSYRLIGGRAIPTGSSYVRLPLLELNSCFLCNGSQTAFILEFKTKTLHLSGPVGIDANQIVKGIQQFQILIEKDRHYVEIWKKKYSLLPPPSPFPASSPSSYYTPEKPTPSPARSVNSTLSGSTSPVSYYNNQLFGKKTK